MFSDQDDIIDLSKLRSSEDESGKLINEDSGLNIEDEFKISHLEFDDEIKEVAEKIQPTGGIEAVPSGAENASNLVKIKFDKFVTLVATHTYEDILKKNAGEDIILSTNLLTDLANAHEEGGGGKKWPLLFAAGIAIGIFLAWLIFKS